MARYIDADKLIAEYDRVHKGPPGGARKLMIEAPVEDVVKVVRCKDCKHRNPYCYKCMRDNLWHGSNDFCSYGKE